MSQNEPIVEQLSNGIRAILLPSASNDIVATVLFYPLPGSIEAPREAGLVSFTHRMLMRGTKKRSSSELAEAIESLGTSMNCGTHDDFSYAHMVATKDTFGASLELMAEVIQRPAFEPDEIEKERQSTLAAIRQSHDDKFTLTYEHFMRELYGTHSYGLPRGGVIETVSEFKREQIVAVHEEFINPASFLAVCVGNFDASEARAALVNLFKPTGHHVELPQIPQPTAVPAHCARIEKDCEQAFLCMGVQAVGFCSPDWAAVRVLNCVLGEGMSSRFFQTLRDEQGLAYATGTSYSAMKLGGHIMGYIGTKPQTLVTARNGMYQLFQQISEELVPEDEFLRSKNYLVGKFLIDHQTNYRRAYYLGHFELMGKGADFDNKYAQVIEAVTAEQVREVARKYLHDYTVFELVPR